MSGDNPKPVPKPMPKPIPIPKNKYRFARWRREDTYKFATETWDLRNIIEQPDKQTKTVILREYRCHFQHGRPVQWEYKLDYQYVWAHPGAGVILTDLRNQMNATNKFQLYEWYKVLCLLDIDCRRQIISILMSIKLHWGKLSKDVALKMPYL